MQPTQELVDVLLDAAFPSGIPPAIDALIDRTQAAHHLDRGKVRPVFPLMAERPVRLVISDIGDSLGWAMTVEQHLQHPELAEFLAGAPEGARREVDTDGRGARVRHVALHRVDPVPPGPRGLPLRQAALVLPDGSREMVTHHPDPPWDPLGDGLLEEGLEELVGVGAVGSYGLRWRQDEVAGLIWYTESHRRGNTDDSRSIAAELGSHPDLWHCMDVASVAGLVPFPYAVELRSDGSWDLELGFC